MELLQSPLAPVLYLSAAVLTAWGAARRGYVLSFLGGLLWGGGTARGWTGCWLSRWRCC